MCSATDSPLGVSEFYLFYKFGKVQLFLSHFDMARKGKKKKDLEMSVPNFSEGSASWGNSCGYSHHMSEVSIQIHGLQGLLPPCQLADAASHVGTYRSYWLLILSR